MTRENKAVVEWMTEFAKGRDLYRPKEMWIYE
jgi:hypothetical protein